MTYSDFQNWLLDPVTKAFYEACNIRIGDAKDVLAASAGLDHAQDNFYRGFIAAYLEMQDFRIDDLEGEE